MFKTKENGWIEIAGVQVGMGGEGQLLILDKDENCFAVPLGLLCKNWKRYYTGIELKAAQCSAIMEVIKI